jgi:hypothetical protein
MYFYSGQPIQFLSGVDSFAGVSVDRPINLLERRGDGLAVFPRDESEAMAQQVDNAEILWGERRGNGTIVAAIEPMRVPHATGQ